MTSRFALTLRCRDCADTESFTLSQIVGRLRELGFLRRGGEPSPELVLELAQSTIDQGGWGACPHCGQRGLGRSDAPDEADDPALWNDPRYCEQCKGIIPAERLEVFPTAKLCRNCQSRADSGTIGDEREFCPRCGDLMQLRAVQSPVAGYRMYCPSCRKTY